MLEGGGESSSRSNAARSIAAICEDSEEDLGAFRAALSEELMPLPRLATVEGDVTIGVEGAGEAPRDEETDLGPTLVCVVSLGVDVVNRWLLNCWLADC